MRGPSAYGGSLWLGALRAAEEIGRELGEGEPLGGLRRPVRARPGELRATPVGRRPLPLRRRRRRRARTASWPTSWPASGTPTSPGLGDLVQPARVEAALRTIHARNVLGFADGRSGAVNGTRPDGSVDRSSEQSQEVWVGTVYALAAFMIGRGLATEGWQTAEGTARVTYERGLWFRTPEAYDERGDYRASLYLRPLAIWAIEEALERVRARGRSRLIPVSAAARARRTRPIRRSASSSPSYEVA